MQFSQRAAGCIPCAPDLAMALNLKRSGRGFTGTCPACGYPTGFSVEDRSGKTLMFCHSGGCSFGQIREALAAQGVCQFRNPQPITTWNPLHTQARPIVCPLPVQKLWETSRHTKGTPVETYLKSRGINCPIPHSIRYVPKAFHPAGLTFPMMLSAVAPWQGYPVMAVHRTFLQADGRGKAQLEPNKMSLGPIKGLSVHFGEPQDVLLITEGVETALSVHQATGIPTWAALSAGGMKALILPPLHKVQRVIICADRDRVGIAAAKTAAERWALEGRSIGIAYPSGQGDFNDMLQREVLNDQKND